MHMPAQGQDVLDALSRLDSAITSSEEEFSPQDAYYIGRAVAAHILGYYALYTKKPELTHYLNKICRTLTVNSSAPDGFNGYHVMILDDNTPNAFSTPGGHIYLSYGLVDLVTSEDMLAAVIAHEIAHIQLHHGIAEIQQDRLVQDLNREQARIARQTEQEIRAEQQRLFTQPVNEMVNILFIRGYSQLQELEADSFALTLLASSGYNPESLIEMLKTLEKSRQGRDGGLYNSHPLPARRLTEAASKAAAYRVKNTQSARKSRFTSSIRGDSR